MIPCPICGSMAYEEEEDFNICELCGWENDGSLSDPDWWGGANEKWSVNTARKAWEEGQTLFENFPNPKANK